MRWKIQNARSVERRCEVVCVPGRSVCGGGDGVEAPKKVFPAHGASARARASCTSATSAARPAGTAMARRRRAQPMSAGRQCYERDAGQEQSGEGEVPRFPLRGWRVCVSRVCPWETAKHVDAWLAYDATITTSWTSWASYCTMVTHA